MNQGILLDTGPLVAFLNQRDRYHDWALAQWGQIAPPLLTCEAVLSEACFLLGAAPNGSDAVVQMLERKIITVSFHLSGHIQPVAKLLAKYSSVPMSLADACLVRMSEVYPDSRVFTLDSDFELYRKHGRQVIPAIMPQ